MNNVSLSQDVNVWVYCKECNRALEAEVEVKHGNHIEIEVNPCKECGKRQNVMRDAEE